eukprot:GSMAST32.ASY1.ANO1.785.1 assembled CDS
MIPTSFVCMSCDGSGKRRGNLTKNARRMLRAAKIWGKPKPNVESMRLVVKCKSCDGSGLISDITGTSLSKEACGAARDRDDFVVGVAGGGIGGLAVALALQQRGIRVIVYERDVSFNERSQGYGLTMQQGGAALEALGIRFEEESISSSAHYSFKPSGEVIGCYGRRLRAAAQRGSSNENNYYENKNTKTEKCKSRNKNRHIPRQRLRQLLYERLLPGTVQWGCRVVEYNDNRMNKVELSLYKKQKHKSQTVSVLVGADGIFSTVRKVKLGDDKQSLRYLNVMVILGIVGYNETVCQTLDGDTRLYSMPFTSPIQESVGHGTTMWQLSFRATENEAKQIVCFIFFFSLRRCSTWHEPIPQLLQDTDFELVTGYPCFDRHLLSAERCRGDSNSRVTFLGDAAHFFFLKYFSKIHPMSPFKGQGANQALLDAKIANSLRKADKVRGSTKYEIPDRTVIDAMAAYERIMLDRSSIKVKQSAEAAKVLHMKEATAAVGGQTRAAVAIAAIQGQNLQTLNHS